MTRHMATTRAWVGIAFVLSLAAVLLVPGALWREHHHHIEGSLRIVSLGMVMMTVGFGVFVADRLAGDRLADDLWWLPFMTGFFFVARPSG